MNNTFENINQECREVETYLNNQGLWVDVYPHNILPVIKVNIEWGDWKHDHLRCDYLMEQLGYMSAGVQTTETDGSDCYSAIHRYLAKNNR